MNRDVRKAANLLADALEDPTHANWPDVARRSILLLAPPKRRVRPRDPRKGERKATVKELDALCRAIVFARDHSECRKCGNTAGKLDWAHVYSRRYRVVRWATSNSMVLCAGCHFWWHHNPSEAVDWWRAQVGAETARRLTLLKNAAKPAPANLIKASLEAEAKRLGVKGV